VLKSKPSKKSAELCPLPAGLFFGLLFNPEDGGNIFL
jgi:hypothetical protein